MFKLITTVRPRSAYQVIRYVDGAKLMLTCTKRGVIGLHRLVTLPMPGEPHVGIERHQRITDPSEQRDAIKRAFSRRQGRFDEAVFEQNLARAVALGYITEGDRTNDTREGAKRAAVCGGIHTLQQAIAAAVARGIPPSHGRYDPWSYEAEELGILFTDP